MRDPDRLRAYRWAMFGLYAALALFSLVQLQLWNGKVYWVRRVLTHAIPFGPYYNPANFAGVMELAVPALAGFAWSRLRRSGRAALYEAEVVVAAVAAALCVVAGFASASKLGALLIVAGMAGLGLLAARSWRQRVVAVALVVVLGAAGALVSIGTRLGERIELFLGRSQDALMLEGRLVAWRASGQMFLDFPVTGAGFGAFQQVFARYVPAGTEQRWSHAHNDYLELLLDGGMVAAALVLWLLVGYVRRVADTFRERGLLSPGRLGLLVGVVALAVHAAFDFNHQIPANALLWLTCCAMLLSENRRRADGRQT